MWWLRLAGTALAVLSAAVALALALPDLPGYGRDIGFVITVGLAVFGVRWTRNADPPRARLVAGLAGVATVGGIVLLAVPSPTNMTLSHLVRLGMRHAGLLMLLAMGTMAVLESLRWWLERRSGVLRRERER